MDGRRVRYIEAPTPDAKGEEPFHLPLLFIHGLGCSAEVWEPTLADLAGRGLCCPSVAPDQPGCGHSLGPREALGIDELAAWLTRFLDERGLSRVHAVGNSMGCQVALALARRHPERVGALVLQGPTTGDSLVPPWRYVAGLMGDAFQETFRYNLKLLKMYTQMGPRRYFATVKRMLADDALAEAEKITAPTLVIRGGKDAIVSDKIARRLVAELPNAVYYPLDSAAHAIEYNNPVEFTDAMLTFLVRAEERLGITTSEGCVVSPASERKEQMNSYARAQGFQATR